MNAVTASCHFHLRTHDEADDEDEGDVEDDADDKTQKSHNCKKDDMIENTKGGGKVNPRWILHLFCFPSSSVSTILSDTVRSILDI